MKPIALIVAAALLCAAAPFFVVNAQDDDNEKAALAALDNFMKAFNARDPKAWAATLNYPHVRFASDSVRVWKTEADFAAYMNFDFFAKQTGWHHSAWDSREVFQSGKDKVHIAVQFSRYDAEGDKIATYKSLYIVTHKNGKWGTQARSSFAP